MRACVHACMRATVLLNLRACWQGLPMAVLSATVGPLRLSPQNRRLLLTGFFVSAATPTTCIDREVVHTEASASWDSERVQRIEDARSGVCTARTDRHARAHAAEWAPWAARAAVHMPFFLNIFYERLFEHDLAKLRSARTRTLTPVYARALSLPWITRLLSFRRARGFERECQCGNARASGEQGRPICSGASLAEPAA